MTTVVVQETRNVVEVANGVVVVVETPSVSVVEVADVPPNSTLTVRRVEYADFIPQGPGFGYIPDWLTLAVGEVITYAGIEIIEAFNDSTMNALDLNFVDEDGNILDNIVDTSTVLSTEFSVVHGIGSEGNTHFPREDNDITAIRVSAPKLISPMVTGWAQDGTTGIADIYLRIETPREL